MALKILAPLPAVPTPAPRMTGPVFTKYQQLACGICHRDPPIATTGICAACARQQDTRLNPPTT